MDEVQLVHINFGNRVDSIESNTSETVAPQVIPRRWRSVSPSSSSRCAGAQTQLKLIKPFRYPAVRPSVLLRRRCFKEQPSRVKETSKKEGKEEGHLHFSDGVAPDLTGVETLSVTPKHESMESTPLM